MHLVRAAMLILALLAGLPPGAAMGVERPACTLRGTLASLSAPSGVEAQKTIPPAFRKLLSEIRPNHGQSRAWTEELIRVLQKWTPEPSQTLRVSLAKELALRNGGLASEYIRSFEIHDPAALIEIASIAARTDGRGTSRYIKKYGIQDEKVRAHIAKLAIENEGAVATQLIRNYEFSSRDIRLEIAAHVADVQPRFFLLPLLEALNLKEVQDSVDIARLSAANGVHWIPGFIENQKLRSAFKSPEDLLETAKIGVRALARQEQQVSDSSLELAYSNWLGLIKNEKHKAILLDEAVATSSEYGLRLATGMRTEPGLEGVQPVVREYLKRAGREEYADLLWDRVKRRESALALTSILTRLKAEHGGWEPLARRLGPQPDSVDILALGIGLDPKSAAGFRKFSSDRLGLVYGLFQDLDRLVRSHESVRPLLSGVEFDPALLTPKEAPRLIRFLETARDRVSLEDGPNRAALWNRLKSDLQTEGELKPLGVDRVQGRMASEVVEKVRSLLSAGSQMDGIQLTYSDFRKLNEKWGDLSPVYTLASRYQGKPVWNPELPELARVFAAEAQGRFSEFKFRGLDEADREAAQRQIGFLSPTARKVWTRTHQRAFLWDPARHADEADILREGKERLRETLSATVLPHLKEGMGLGRSEPVRFSDSTEAGAADAAVQIIVSARSAPKDTLAALRTKGLSENRILQSLLKGLEDGNAELASPDTVRSEQGLRKLQSLTSFFLGNRDEIVQGLAPGKGSQLGRQIVQDLEHLRRSLGSLKQVAQTSHARRTLLFATTFNDAKNLLEIGTLVDTASCQNYRTGGHIQTLLGYVEDANVQGVAAFALGPTHFASKAQFELIAVMMEKGAEMDLSFQPERKVARIRFTDDGGKLHEIDTLPLDKAHRRHVLKVGQSEENAGTAGVRMERAYAQNHPAGEYMGELIEELIEDMARQMGASTTDRIWVPRSRNPGGVYSDEAGGAMIDDYSF